MASDLWTRREANVGKQVDNSSLHAGSPMYYYCLCCGAQTAVLPEGWYRERPPRYCDACLALPVDERTSYNEWLQDRGHSKMPS